MYLSPLQICPATAENKSKRSRRMTVAPGRVSAFPANATLVSPRARDRHTLKYRYFTCCCSKSWVEVPCRLSKSIPSTTTPWEQLTALPPPLQLFSSIQTDPPTLKFDTTPLWRNGLQYDEQHEQPDNPDQTVRCIFPEALSQKDERHISKMERSFPFPSPYQTCL